MLAIALALQLTAAATVPTVLVFTTTDCPISNRYAPEIKRLDGEIRRQGAIRPRLSGGERYRPRSFART